MTIDIKLTEEHIEYLKWFKNQNRPELTGYHPVVLDLEYLGILLTTNLDSEGIVTNKLFVLPTGIGKQILNCINNLS